MTLARIFFFSFLATSVSHAVEMTMYFCEAGDLDLSLMVFPEDGETQYILSAERGDTKIDFTDRNIEENNSIYHIKAAEKNLGEIVMFLPKRSESDAVANDSGLIDYQEEMIVVLEINKDGDQSLELVTCKPYGLTNKFFDIIASAIP